MRVMEASTGDPCRRSLGAMWLMLVMVIAADTCQAAGGTGGSAKPAPLPVLTLTLGATLAAVADNNPDVLWSKERVAAAQGQVQAQLGTLLPNLSSGIRQTRQTQFLGTFGLAPVRTDPFSIFDSRVSASHNLVSIGLIQRWRASRESMHVAELESDSRRYDAMASAALLYMDGLRAMEMARMHESNEGTMRELLTIVKQRHKSGAATGLEIARLEAQAANERQAAVSSRYDLQHATLNLLNLMSLPYETRILLSDAFRTDVGGGTEPEAAVGEAMVNRPEVQAQATRVKASELLYASMTGERLPSLVAQGDYGLVGNRWNNALDTYSMALLVQIPLFDGGQREGRIAEARSQLRQEVLRMQSVLNQVKLEVHDALAGLAAAKDQLVIAQAGTRAAAKELDLARERYAVLTAASYFELTNALGAVARARENLVNALFQLNVSRVNLARATGTLNFLGAYRR